MVKLPSVSTDYPIINKKRRQQKDGFGKVFQHFDRFKKHLGVVSYLFFLYYVDIRTVKGTVGSMCGKVWKG